MVALRHNPFVELVGRNLPVELHASGGPTIPNDGLLGVACDTPETTQWGIHQLRLPEAWSWAKGHGYVGLIDTGAEVEHPDLRAFHEDLGVTFFDGGNLRQHLSRDVDDLNCSVDERDLADNPPPGDNAGHGTHVSGIVAATTDNQQPGDPPGAAGVCWHCSLLMARTAVPGTTSFLDSRADGLVFLYSEAGAQVVSMSWGIMGELDASIGDPLDCVSGQDESDLFCQVLTLAQQREVLMAASSGNWRYDGHIEFPAREPRVMAVGGVQQAPGCSFERWIKPGSCEDVGFGFQCGSNTGPEQELVAPARRVLSTMYTGYDHNPGLVCGDLQFDGVSPGVADGFGPCTGTSMSSPFVAGLAGIVRSINPLLEVAEARDVMTSTASQAASRDDTFGYGLPDAEAAVRRALGTLHGATMTNRLTPLFGLYSSVEQTHAYTTVPTFATALIFDDPEPFDSEPFAPLAPGIDSFPGFNGTGEPVCDSTDCEPRASLFVFTTEASPYAGAPPLVPLYRMRYNSAVTPACPSPPSVSAASSRDFALATTEDEVLFLAEDVVDGSGIGYQLDGIDGYLYATCSGDVCQPPGTVRVLRRYDPVRGDFAIFPESQAGLFPSYAVFPDPSLPEVIGYAYENVDSDFDELIDGWERLLGTGILVVDSDGDAIPDGTEVLNYDASDPDPALHGYGDPCSNGCPILFADGFESGDTSEWSGVVP